MYLDIDVHHGDGVQAGLDSIELFLGVFLFNSEELIEHWNSNV